MNDATFSTSPAPWRVEAGDSVVGIYSPSGRVAVTNTKTYYQRHDDRDIANANLIAAAPDLLEALRELRTLVEMEDWWNDPADRNYPLRYQIEAAIAKAEGRDS
jgi:hypothetical protein